MTGAAAGPSLRIPWGVARRSILSAAAPVVLAAAAGALLYARALGAGFLSDDFVHLFALAEGGPTALWWRGGVFLRPLVGLSLAADLHLWGLGAAAYHLHNVLCHAVNAVLVGLLGRQLAVRIGGPEIPAGGARRMGWLAGALFLVVPGHAECVAWISGRTDVYATLFALAAMVAFMGDREGRRGWLTVASVVAYAAALSSKESAVVVPVLLVVVEVAGRRGRSVRQAVGAIRAVAPHLAVTGGYLLLRALLLDHPWRGPLAAAPEPLAVLRAALVHLVKLTGAHWPARVVAPLGPLRGDWAPAVALILATAGALAAVVWWGVRGRPDHRRLVVVAALLAFAALLPVIHLPGTLLWSESDRFLYLPSAAVAFAAAVVVHGLAGSRRSFVLAVSVPLLVAGALLWWTCGLWQQAGVIAGGVVDAAAAAALRGRVEAVAVPDSLRGAYILRHGLAEAVRLRRPDRAPAGITVRATFPMSTPTTEPRVEGHVGRALLTLPGSRRGFRVVRGAGGCVDVEVRPPAALLVEDRCPPETGVLLYRDGGLVRLERALRAEGGGLPAP